MVDSRSSKTAKMRLSTIYKSTVNTILDVANIKPHKITCCCENREIDLDTEMHDVLLVYKQQSDEEGMLATSEGNSLHVLPYDEKPGMQAIVTSSDDLMPAADYPVICRDYEYKRLGTL